jgi:phage terminase large subunit GpA-like protein
MNAMCELENAAQPFDAGTFHERCPACGTCNRVQITEQYGHNWPYDYHCAHCHHRLGSLRASALLILLAGRPPQDA